MRYLKTDAVSAAAVVALVITGVPSLITIVSARLAVAVPLVAVMVAAKVPAAVGRPLMTPVAALTASPAGRPLAPNAVGLLVAVIW
jgi:hypothetical protein